MTDNSSITRRAALGGAVVAGAAALGGGEAMAQAAARRVIEELSVIKILPVFSGAKRTRLIADYSVNACLA